MGCSATGVKILTHLIYCLCSLAQGFRSLSDFAAHLAASVDIVFPVIHGQFGEDGGIQVLCFFLYKGLILVYLTQYLRSILSLSDEIEHTISSDHA